jgi:multidrug transporter EmrE-like cation transporter
MGAFVANAAANVLLKMAALNGFSFGGFFRGEWNLATLTAGVAVAIFGLNLCLYLVALEKIPLSVGYPVMVGMTFVITTIASLAFGEKINLIHAFGMALIFAGILLVVRFAAA